MMLNKVLTIAIYASHYPEFPFFAAVRMRAQSVYDALPLWTDFRVEFSIVKLNFPFIEHPLYETCHLVNMLLILKIVLLLNNLDD